MNQKQYISVLVLLATVALLAGCHDNPNLRKEKYLESGKRFSADGKYRDAAIQFLNALKVDKDYADAHFELARNLRTPRPIRSGNC